MRATAGAGTGPGTLARVGVRSGVKVGATRAGVHARAGTGHGAGVIANEYRKFWSAKLETDPELKRKRRLEWQLEHKPMNNKHFAAFGDTHLAGDANSLQSELELDLER